MTRSKQQNLAADAVEAELRQQLNQQQIEQVPQSCQGRSPSIVLLQLDAQEDYELQLDTLQQQNAELQDEV